MRGRQFLIAAGMLVATLSFTAPTGVEAGCQVLNIGCAGIDSIRSPAVTPARCGDAIVMIDVLTQNISVAPKQYCFHLWVDGGVSTNSLPGTGFLSGDAGLDECQVDPHLGIESCGLHAARYVYQVPATDCNKATVELFVGGVLVAWESDSSDC